VADYYSVLATLYASDGLSSIAIANLFQRDVPEMQNVLDDLYSRKYPMGFYDDFDVTEMMWARDGAIRNALGEAISDILNGRV